MLTTRGGGGLLVNFIGDTYTCRQVRQRSCRKVETTAKKSASGLLQNPTEIFVTCRPSKRFQQNLQHSATDFHELKFVEALDPPGPGKRGVKRLDSVGLKVSRSNATFWVFQTCVYKI